MAMRRDEIEVRRERATNNLWRLGRLCTAAISMGLALMMIGCGGDICVDSFAVNIDPTSEWSRIVRLEIPNRDTTSLRDISIFVRYQPTHKLDTLRLILRTSSPDSTTLSEQVILPLRESSTKGRRNTTQTIERVYRRDAVLRESGDYQISIYPQTPTKGIEAVGLHLDFK